MGVLVAATIIGEDEHGVHVETARGRKMIITWELMEDAECCGMLSEMMQEALKRHRGDRLPVDPDPSVQPPAFVEVERGFEG